MTTQQEYCCPEFKRWKENVVTLEKQGDTWIFQTRNWCGVYPTFKIKGCPFCLARLGL